MIQCYGCIGVDSAIINEDYRKGGTVLEYFDNKADENLKFNLNRMTLSNAVDLEDER